MGPVRGHQCPYDAPSVAEHFRKTGTVNLNPADVLLFRDSLTCELSPLGRALPRLLASSINGARIRILHTHLTVDFALTGLGGPAEAGCGTHQRLGWGSNGWAAAPSRRIGMTRPADRLEDNGDTRGQRT